MEPDFADLDSCQKSTFVIDSLKNQCFTGAEVIA